MFIGRVGRAVLFRVHRAEFNRIVQVISLSFVSFVVLCEESTHIRSELLQLHQVQVQVWHRALTWAMCVRVYEHTCSSSGAVEAHHFKLSPSPLGEFKFTAAISQTVCSS